MLAHEFCLRAICATVIAFRNGDSQARRSAPSRSTGPAPSNVDHSPNGKKSDLTSSAKARNRSAEAAEIVTRENRITANKSPLASEPPNPTTELMR